MLLNLFQSLKFAFLITLEDTSTDCEAWVAENFMGKISDVQDSLVSGLDKTACSNSDLPCLSNGDFVCGNDPSVVTYE